MNIDKVLKAQKNANKQYPAIRIDGRTYKFLKELAADRGVTIRALVRGIVDEYAEAILALQDQNVREYVLGDEAKDVSE